MPKRFNIEKKIKAFERTKRTLPARVGNVAKNHFLQSFENEAFSYNSVGSDPWEKRKTKTKQDKRTGKRRALLVQSGALRRSIRVKSANWKAIRVGSYGIKYATYHNNGTSRLPQRQFIGKSPLMEGKIRKLVSNEINKLSKI